LQLKCTKFDFGWGSTPDPAGELTALRGGAGRGGKGGVGAGEGREKGGQGREGTPAFGLHPPEIES